MITPVAMNVAVATIERVEPRLIPHTPCPLVHPFPRAVPTPTEKSGEDCDREGPRRRAD